jgi:hypothetical protein
MDYKYENDKKRKGSFSEALNYWIEVFFGMNKKFNVTTLDGLVHVVCLVYSPIQTTE